jgi:hypothetical protein
MYRNIGTYLAQPQDLSEGQCNELKSMAERTENYAAAPEPLSRRQVAMWRAIVSSSQGKMPSSSHRSKLALYVSSLSSVLQTYCCSLTLRRTLRVLEVSNGIESFYRVVR